MTSKEELGKIKKLIFIIGEILVAESKQDISPEEAIQRIRKTCNKYGVNGTDYETIKQDLEMLEIIKKYIEFNDYHYNDKDQNCIDILIPESDENYRVIKEWLNNDCNKRIH